MSARRPDAAWFYVPLLIGIVALVLALAWQVGQRVRDVADPVAPRLADVTASSADAVAPYSAAEFGRWRDEDGDCQDTRNEVLLRDLVEVVMDERECLVLSGILVDRYTGETVEFTRGRATSGAVQVDHVVARKDAWDDGAYLWTDEERRAFSNDLDNLVATAGPVNASKGERGPAGWSPPDPAALCPYLQTYQLVAADYGLATDDVDRQAIATGLDGCAVTRLTGR